jgi:hypothetical protein
MDLVDLLHDLGPRYVLTLFEKDGALKPNLA